MLSISQFSVLSLAWVIYFLLHSVMASHEFKRALFCRWPGVERSYRLLFNAIAVATLVPILWLLVIWRGDPLWQWQGAWLYLMNGLAVTAVAGFVWSLRYYDGQEFAGIRQWRGDTAECERMPGFVLSPLHRVVRHPWYFLALVIIWTRSMDAAFLLSAVAMTLYFYFGSRLEEAKLVAEIGEPYRRYRAYVAPLVPLPWCVLSQDRLRELEQLGAKLDAAKK